jgi:hypothetical protein
VGRGKGEEGRGGGVDGSRPGRRKRRKEQVVVAGQVLRGWRANANVTCDLRKTKHQPVTREGVFRETTYLCGVCLKPIKKTLKLIYYGLKKIRVVACIVAMLMMALV